MESIKDVDGGGEDGGGSCKHLGPYRSGQLLLSLLVFCLLFVKNIDLAGEQINDPSSGKTSCALLFLPATPSRLGLRPLTGFLSWHTALHGPSTSPRALLLELKRYIQRHRQVWCTMRRRPRTQNKWRKPWLCVCEKHFSSLMQDCEKPTEFDMVSDQTWIPTAPKHERLLGAKFSNRSTLTIWPRGQTRTKSSWEKSSAPYTRRNRFHCK